MQFVDMASAYRAFRVSSPLFPGLPYGGNGKEWLMRKFRLGVMVFSFMLPALVHATNGYQLSAISLRLKSTVYGCQSYVFSV